MAIPSFFATSSGFALMRGLVSTGEWWFVDWVNGEVDVIIDSPGPGTWAYQVWVVCGAGGPWIAGGYGYPTGTSGRADLTVQSLKR
jgi:hypothetical protein